MFSRYDYPTHVILRIKALTDNKDDLTSRPLDFNTKKEFDLIENIISKHDGFVALQDFAEIILNENSDARIARKGV